MFSIVLRFIYIVGILLSSMSLNAADGTINTLDECIKYKMVRNNIKDITVFAEALNNQKDFIKHCADSLAVHREILKKKDFWVNEKKSIHEKLKVTSNAEQTVHTFKLNSNNATAWALRYGKIGTLITPDAAVEQYDEAKSILDRWSNTDDDEIKSLITLYTNQFDLVHCIKKDTIARKTMAHHMQYFYELVKNKPVLKSPNSPLAYSCFLTGLVGHIFKTSNSISIVDAADATQNAYKTIESIMSKYEKEGNRFATLQQQIEQKIKPPSTPINKEEWIPESLKKNNEKKKKPAQPTKKKTRSRNNGKEKYIEQKTDTIDEASSSSSSGSSDQTPLAYPKRTATDNSSTISEDDTKVRIFDPKNKVTLTLWKVAEPQKIYSSPHYTRWVKMWFSDPKQAMEEQGYNNLDNAKYHLKDSAQLVHSFSSEADRYLTQCGVVSNIVNNKNKQHIAITIPGYITYPNTIEDHGLFTYFIDNDNGKWYHRNFVKKPREELYAEYMNAGLYEVEFPELNQSIH